MIVPNRIHNSGKYLKPKLKPVAIRQSKARLKALINKLKVN
jgi:hypothetical protein